LKNFKSGHSELTSRRSQPLEVARARGLCQSTVATLYENLESLYNTYKFPPSHIWNCDESGVQAGRSGGARVLAKVGSKLVLDGHNSHVTLELVQCAMKERLDIVTLPG
jgi:hypothetical protein